MRNVRREGGKKGEREIQTDTKKEQVAHRQYMVIGTLGLHYLMFVKVERKQGSGPEGDEVL